MSRNGDSRLWIIKLADGTRRLAAQADAVGGRWSPNGHRIAYWGLTPTSSRDIWTVPSDGSGSSSPVKVTTDDAVDWGPAWSPDGRFLYFSSSRGGTMNLWRVRIDQESGRTLGEPEPVTTPTAWSGNIEFAADGERLVFADQDERSTIWAVDFDPVRGVIAGAPRAILQGRAINSIDSVSGWQPRRVLAAAPAVGGPGCRRDRWVRMVTAHRRCFLPSRAELVA